MEIVPRKLTETDKKYLLCGNRCSVGGADRRLAMREVESTRE
jgi:hypothetical protein